VQFQSTGGIFLRLDSSGNLNVYDTSGTSIAKFTSGAYSSKLNKGTVVSNGSLATTTSASPVTTGNSVQITPRTSGSVLIIALMNGASNSTVNATCNLLVYQSTGTNNPASNSVPDGSAILNTSTAVSSTANAIEPLIVTGVVTGLTAGTAYTFEMAVTAAGGGTMTLGNRSLQAIEL
jgi:hypothetical protein